LRHICRNTAKVSILQSAANHLLIDRKIVITLCRVFTEQETTQGYHRLFTRVFALISKVTGKEVRFSPIHGGGIHALVLDMCTKQMAGM
jgi:hypothetical protein